MIKLTKYAKCAACQLFCYVVARLEYLTLAAPGSLEIPVKLLRQCIG